MNRKHRYVMLCCDVCLNDFSPSNSLNSSANNVVYFVDFLMVDFPMLLFGDTVGVPAAGQVLGCSAMCHTSYSIRP